jgi:uncharacterized Tic20 family protein
MCPSSTGVSVSIRRDFGASFFVDAEDLEGETMSNDPNDGQNHGQGYGQNHGQGYGQTPSSPSSPSSPALMSGSGPLAVTAEERQMAGFAHLLGAIFGLIVPLVLWLMKKDTSRFVDAHGKEALNFHITIMIAYATIGSVTCGVGVLPIWIASIIFGVQGFQKANAGELYRYPVALRLIS